MYKFKTIDEYTFLKYTYERLLELWCEYRHQYEKSVTQGNPDELAKARAEKYHNQLNEIHDALLELESER